MDIPCTDNNRQLKSKAYLYQRTVSMNLEHGGFLALLKKKLNQTHIFRAELLWADSSWTQFFFLSFNWAELNKIWALLSRSQLRWACSPFWFSPWNYIALAGLEITWLKYKAQPQDILVFQIKSANKINKFSFFCSVCPLAFEIT